eukprot:TRINITY_DN13909_c0_g1_i3.p1 TRINITY_DN13909_c0_g1~~TRINITY_DN13909_c0_g1_i3.p1  ORF type:complete len:473 (+),score=36.60 TRINITY_DN13909_c0_g1_i3:28-1446(+)
MQKTLVQLLQRWEICQKKPVHHTNIKYLKQSFEILLVYIEGRVYDMNSSDTVNCLWCLAKGAQIFKANTVKDHLCMYKALYRRLIELADPAALIDLEDDTYQDQKKLFQMLRSRKLNKRPETISSMDLSLALHSLGKIPKDYFTEFKFDLEFQKLVEIADRQRVGSFSHIEKLNVLWAMAKTNYRQILPISRFFDGVLHNFHYYTPTELTTLVWFTKRMGILNTSFYEQISRLILTGNKKFTVKELSTILQTFVHVGYDKLRVLESQTFMNLEEYDFYFGNNPSFWIQSFAYSGSSPSFVQKLVDKMIEDNWKVISRFPKSQMSYLLRAQMWMQYQQQYRLEFPDEMQSVMDKLIGLRSNPGLPTVSQELTSQIFEELQKIFPHAQQDVEICNGRFFADVGIVQSYRIAILVVNDYYYLLNDSQRLLGCVQNHIKMLEFLDWQVVTVNIHKWNDQQERIKLIMEIANKIQQN